jgi:hypothetical protein
MTSLDPEIAAEAQARAQADGIHIRLLELIVQTTDPYVLAEASRALLSFEPQFLHLQSNQNLPFRELVIQSVQKLQAHWDPEIKELGVHLSKSL